MGSSCSALFRGENDKTTNISSVTTHDLKLNKCGGVDVTARLIGNGATNIACLHTQQGKKGTNQDAMIAWEVRLSYFPPPPFLFRVSSFRVMLFCQVMISRREWNENFLTNLKAKEKM